MSPPRISLPHHGAGPSMRLHGLRRFRRGHPHRARRTGERVAAQREQPELVGRELEYPASDVTRVTSPSINPPRTILRGQTLWLVRILGWALHKTHTDQISWSRNWTSLGDARL